MEVVYDIENVEDTDDTPLFRICEKEGIAAVLDAIKKLSEPQRDVLILYYLHHHTLKEIAVLLHISESAAASRFTREKHALMEILERRGYHE